MFQRASILSCLLLIVIFPLIYFYLIRPHPEDFATYRDLMQASLELRAHKAIEKAPVHQLRKGVQKDIWTPHIDGRHHFCLKSDQSYLTLMQKKGKIEAVEELEQINGIVQEAEDSTKTTHQLRRFQAEKGTYYFPSHNFSAQIVRLASSQTDGDWLHAEKMTFNLLKKEMLCFSPQGYLSDKNLSFSARSARTLFTERFDPLLFLLEGNVAVQGLYQNKESFAASDAILYKVAEKEAHLTADFPKRVLFWQEGLEMSAPKICITNAIKAVGDVRFILKTEEKNHLQEIFAKHL